MNKFEKIIPYTFKKPERLSSKKTIQELFKNGSSFYLHPLKVLYLPNTQSEVNQVLFTVPKRLFKKAVDRNLLKRRLREAYRLQKHLLPSEFQIVSIAYIYTSKDICDYHTIANQLKQSLIRIRKHIEKEQT